MSKIIMQLQKEFCKNFDSLTGRQDRRIVWEDFITISQHALDIHKHLEGEPLPTHIADFYHDEEWECLYIRRYTTLRLWDSFRDNEVLQHAPKAA